MANWHEYAQSGQAIPEWPYPIRYENEQVIGTDVLVLGGGIAGCWAAISAARKGARVVLVEKSATIRSGAGGPGCDHWCDTPANPLSKVDPDEWAQQLANANGGYGNGIGREIQCRENYDTLLELEKMGAKIRDTEGEYKDAEGWDESTQFVISPRSNPFHDTNVVIRVWGTTFKRALKRECERLGVNIYDRVMVTSLLNEGGVQGGRVVGATGVNNRTGEFMVFEAKATILCMSGTVSLWVFNTELSGLNTFRSRALSGDGTAMAWRAGAELTMMEKSGLHRLGGGYKHQWYTGAGDASYENVPLVDAQGKPLPVVAEWSWGKTLTPRTGTPMGPWAEIRDGVLKGEYALPFYGDFPSMAAIERKVTWNFLLNEESATKIIVDSYTESGFDPAKDQLVAYQLLEGTSPAQWRSIERGPDRGGVLIDWNLKTSLDGLYAAGEQLYAPGDHSFAAATGRYAGRKAADYALQTGESLVSREQIAKEKARVYAPIQRTKGIDWKELHAGIAKVMQYFCSEYKTESLLKMGLDSLKEIEEKWVPTLYAPDPHKLMRSLEDLSILNYAQSIIQASLARKASSKWLDFQRIDFPQVDPPEWDKFLTVKLEKSKVKVGELPLTYCGNLKQNYEAHNRDYRGVWQD
jgi:succinate dehydrogenase/fumarate reductase flavoprotein subunit